MGEMPQAAERRDNCHMQSLRGYVCESVCLCINHSTPVLCYYRSERGNLPPSAPRQAAYKPNSCSTAGIRSKMRAVCRYNTERKPVLRRCGFKWNQELCTKAGAWGRFRGKFVKTPRLGHFLCFFKVRIYVKNVIVTSLKQDSTENLLGLRSLSLQVAASL